MSRKLAEMVSGYMISQKERPEEIMEFIKNNNVWAVYLTAEEAAGEYAALLGLDTPVYADMDGDGIIEKAN